MNAMDLIAMRAEETCANGHFDAQSTAPVPSPCISVCRIAPERGHCAGCFRTLDEIAIWSRADAPLRRAIWLRLLERAGLALPCAAPRPAQPPLPPTPAGPVRPGLSSAR